MLWISILARLVDVCVPLYMTGLAEGLRIKNNEKKQVLCACSIYFRWTMKKWRQTKKKTTNSQWLIFMLIRWMQFFTCCSAMQFFIITKITVLASEIMGVCMCVLWYKIQNKHPTALEKLWVCYFFVAQALIEKEWWGAVLGVGNFFFGEKILIFSHHLRLDELS